MQIEPDTKIVQTHFGSQTSLKSRQVVRALTSQAKSVQEFVVDRFDDLPNTGQPATQGFRPANALTGLMRRCQQIDLALLSPPLAWSLSGKAEVFHIGALSGQACAGQPRRGSLADRKQRCDQVLVMGEGRAKAKTGNDPHWIHRQQEPTSPSRVAWHHG